MELSVAPIARDVVCLSLNGRLDTPGVDHIETRFTAAAVAAGEHAIVDLGDVTFISSMGVRLLLSAARAMQQKGRRMVLFGAQPLVLETLDNVAIDELIPLKDSRNDALSAALAA